MLQSNLSEYAFSYLIFLLKNLDLFEQLNEVRLSYYHYAFQKHWVIIFD